MEQERSCSFYYNYVTLTLFLDLVIYKVKTEQYNEGTIQERWYTDMKFYYNGKLVRTSKSHHYTHALINTDGNAVACSTDPNRLAKEKERYIKSVEKALSYYRSIENAEMIAYDEMLLAERRQWRVVEVEERA